jgi:Lrp/AsnC family transcriptional regulator for asnA, asnC and gidA
MDELDTKIIETLVADARTSFRQIAKELDKSPDTVSNRFDKMQEEGIIRGSTIVVEPRAIGYQGMAAFHIDTKPGSNTTEILQTLIKMPNIIVATKTLGPHEVLALGVIHDFDHIMRIREEVATIPGIRNIRTALWASGQEISSRFFII